jgi:hypothetical protein
VTPTCLLVAALCAIGPTRVGTTPMDAARRPAGVNGILLFSYDTLVAAPNGPEYLAAIGKAAFSGS